MIDKIQQARRVAFESYFSRMANSHLIDAKSAWLGFNAALDSLEIKFPLEVKRAFHEYDLGYNEAIDSCRAAIESTNLGIKVK